MRFELYLDAVSFCRHNKISMDNITRHEKDGKRYWVVTNTEQANGFFVERIRCVTPTP